LTSVSSFAKEGDKTSNAETSIRQHVEAVTTKIGETINQNRQPLRDSFLHPGADSESWTFSGIVFDESNARYGYSFLVLRQGDLFKVISQVVLMSNGEELFHYLSEKEIKNHEQQGVNLKINDAFLRYNEVSDSWVFGVNQKQGFNFRVEANQKYDYRTEHVPGVSFYSLQGMRINGQLSLKDKNVFVVAKNAWLSHQWRDSLSSSYNIKRLYCRFGEDKGLLLEQINRGDDRLFDGATLLEASGKQDSVSQFVQLSKLKESKWEVHVISPKLDLIVESVTPLDLESPYGTLTLYAGIIQKAPSITGGFCILTEDKPVKMASPVQPEVLVTQEEKKEEK
jgi:hypothetical protein